MLFLLPLCSLFQCVYLRYLVYKTTKMVSFKKLESSQERFLENESSTYRWKRVLRRKKYRWNFEIMFCSIFIKEIMADKSKKRSNSAGKNSSKNFWDTFWKISPILFFEGHFQGSLLKISEPTDVLTGLWSFLKKKKFSVFLAVCSRG